VTSQGQLSKVSNLIEHLSRFIDSLGVVIARLVVLSVLCLFSSLPVLIAVYLSVTYWPALNSILAAYLCYAFLVFSAIAFLHRFRSVIALGTGNDFLTWCAFGLIITVAPLLILFALIARGDTEHTYFLTRKHYLNDQNVFTMLCYLMSIISFVLAIYLVGIQPASKNIYFEQNPGQLRDAILFTLDIAIRGLFFDLFDHFNIHVSNVYQTSDLFGKSLTYVLRLSSLVLAIGLIMEMTSATRERLRKLDEGSSN
jgi:hypothetical protein